jgi:uncharacterized protein (DUF427 family)
MRPVRTEPGPGQESVWDYPRPPSLLPTARRVRVAFNGVSIADSVRALRVCETASAPTYYVPANDVRTDLLERVTRTSYCEYKGRAGYYDIVVGDRRARRAAWYYPHPRRAYAALAGHVAFYASRVDAAWLDDESVTPQPGGFYGGWITADVVGPFKGEPGSLWW